MTAADRDAGGKVWLVGAGPGDAELLTLKAVRVLGQADVVLYDRLIGEDVLSHAAPSAELIYAGKRRANHHMRQVEIHEVMINRARRGQTVVRLKGGDPSIFGRAGEEAEALIEAGVPFEIVPGITAASACAADFALPLTHRDHSHTLILATGHAKDGEPDLNWRTLCQPQQTLVFYMGHNVLPRLCARLAEEGLGLSMPVTVIENGGRAERRRLDGTLADIARIVERAELTGPALVIVGETAGLGIGRRLAQPSGQA